MCSDHIIQYHEVIGGLIGPWGERAALFFNVVSLLGLAVVQIIACASDAYYLYDGRTKGQLYCIYTYLYLVFPKCKHSLWQPPRTFGSHTENHEVCNSRPPPCS